MKIHAHIASMWRYADALPLDDTTHCVTLGEGWTPLIDAPRFAQALGCERLLVKDEGQNPTGTFKDRSASLTISRLREGGTAGIVLHSTGNASAAFAIYAARAGLECAAFVPSDLLDANVAQMRLAGADIHKLDDWSRASAMASAYADRSGYLNVSAGRTPYRIQGKMTLGYEIAEQLDWRLPDAIICPTGGGTGVLALQSAFDALLARGLAHGPRPRLFISQYEGCAPLVEAHRNGRATTVPWARIDTPRGGMRTASPSAGEQVLAVISGGGAYAVSAPAALGAARAIARADGILVGLEGGTALAAVRAALDCGNLSSHSTIVVINTGTALKSDPALTIEQVTAPKTVVMER
jgi:threonine synthase